MISCGSPVLTVKEFFRKEGAKGGRIGRKGRSQKLSAERRSVIARKAAAARRKYAGPCCL